MKLIYALVTKIVSELPTEYIQVAAKRILSKTDFKDIDSVWDGQLAQSKIINEFNVAAVSSGLSPKEIASALFAAAATADYFYAENKVDVLWSGPKSTTIPVRRMEQAFCELIESAERKLVVVSFVVYKADKIYNAIRDAIGRGVRVSFLTEASKEHGGSLDVDPIKILRSKFSEADFYRWERSDSSQPAVVHVKCAIADEKVALVTSANLTGAAMEDNMELGLMVFNRHAVGRIANHFSALITENVIKKVL